LIPDFRGSPAIAVIVIADMVSMISNFLCFIVLC